MKKQKVNEKRKDTKTKQTVERNSKMTSKRQRNDGANERATYESMRDDETKKQILETEKYGRRRQRPRQPTRH